MLRKIDCVMIQVEDVKAAMAYYSDVFGLRPVWWDERAAGLVFPESDAEIVVHCNLDIPSRVEVHRKAGRRPRCFRPGEEALPNSHACTHTHRLGAAPGNSGHECPPPPQSWW